MNTSNPAATAGVREDFCLLAHLRPQALVTALSRGQTIVWVLVLSLVARSILAILMPLTADEAYAVVVSRSHALSYYDHPPLAFALARLMADLTDSESPGILRLPFVLMGTGSTIFLYDITRRAYGAKAALWACLAFCCSPFFFTFTGGLIVPDGPLDFFLLLSFWSLQPVLMGGPSTWKSWLLTGGALALAVLSKYHAVLFGTDAILALAINPVWRRHFATPKIWVAIGLAALGGIPVLIWNATHDWASFMFQTGRAYHDAGFISHATNFLQVIAGQALYLMPMTWFVAQREIWRSIAKPDMHLSRLLAGVAAAPIIIFDIIATVGHHSLPHWTMSGFLFALPLVGKARAQSSGDPLQGLRAYLAGGVVLALGFGLAIQAQLGLLTRLAPAQFRDWDLGWHDLDWTAINGNLPEANAFIIAPNWVSAGHIGLAAGASHPIDILTDPHQFQYIDRCRLLTERHGYFVTYLPLDYKAGQPVEGVESLASQFVISGPVKVIHQTRMGVPAFDIAILPILRKETSAVRNPGSPTGTACAGAGG